MNDSAPTPIPEFNQSEVQQKKTLCGIFGIGSIIGIIEGVIYLTKSDQEFYDTYMANKKEWF